MIPQILRVMLTAAILGSVLLAPALASDEEVCDQFHELVETSPALAVTACHRLAESGDATAQLNVGSMYYLGVGVTQNFEEAARWYRKAADQGLATAEVALGGLYALARASH